LVTDLPVFMSATGYRSAKLTPFSSLHRPSGDRLVHRAVVDDRHVDFHVAALRLHAGDVVGRVAGHVLELGAGLLSNAGMISLRIMSSNEPP